MSFRAAPKLLGVPLGLSKSHSSGALLAEHTSQRWALLRLHFLTYRRESRRLVRQQWYSVIAAAVKQKAEAEAQLRAAAAIFRPVSLKRIPQPPVNLIARTSFDDSSHAASVVHAF